MNKKALVAAVLAAVSFSATAFANPVITGDARIKYENDNPRTFENRIRLNVDGDVDNILSVHGRAVMQNGVDTGKAATSFDQAYVGANVDGLAITAGLQPLYLGQGMLADTDSGISGVKVATSLDNVKISGFYGKDQQLLNDGSKVTAFDLGTSVSGVNLGASYLKVGDANKYMGLNAAAKLSPVAVLSAEYVKNDDNTADNPTGYLAAVKFGNTVNRGDVAYTVSYRDVDAGAVNTAYSTDANYDNSKGVRVAVDYKVSKNATLSAFQDFTTTQADVNSHRTDVQLNVNF